MGGTRRPPHGGRTGVHLGAHRRASRSHQEPGARARTRPSQLIATGFVETALSSRVGDGFENSRHQLRATLPIRCVVGPADVPALAVHIMTNTALTGATYDVEGAQQRVAG